MLQLLCIIITAVIFAKASKNKTSSPLFWALIGVLYFVIGYVLCSFITGLGYVLFSTQKTAIQFTLSHHLIPSIFCNLFGLLVAYFPGEISGLNIRRAINNN